MDIKEILKELGLNEKEAEVYLAVLELGQANILEIAKTTGIPRATIYNLIGNLISHDFIGSIIKGKRTLYFAGNPRKLKQKLQDKQKALEKILPDLTFTYQHSSRRPVIHTYEGVEGIEKMLDDILVSVPRGASYNVILNAKDELPLMGKEYDKFLKKRLEKQISIRVIAERSPLTIGWHKKEADELRQFKFLPKNQHFSVSYHIYGNKVSMFSLQGPIIGVLIENKEIAGMESLQFEYMWKALD